MALLSEKARKKRFEYLGLGDYNKKNILKFQKMAFPNDKSEWDSKYGQRTDFALRTFYNVKRYGGGHFEPAEFRCNCGRCSGYPSYMKKVEMEHIEKIREHYKKPMTITSGLRCPHENSRVGGVSNSGHLRGYAVDFYMNGVTDSVENRVKALKWISAQPNHQLTYGSHMRDSDGLYREASGMGNAMHTETHKPEKKADPLQPWYDALKTQSEWSKHAKYQWVNPPTVANSKFKKTCIALPMVALQRLGIFKKGGWFYLDLKTGKINGPMADFVKKHKDIFEIHYPNKSVREMGDSIHKGDIVAYTGGRGHIMVYMGKNSKGQHIFATGGHVNSMRWVSPYFAKKKIAMLVRLKKVG